MLQHTANPGRGDGGVPPHALAVFALSVFVLLLVQSRQLGAFDEGIVLVAAQRVLAGEVPHRDFYYVYGAGYPYLHAALFQVLGPGAVVERVLDALLRGTIVVGVYAFVHPRCRPMAAAAACVMTLVWLAFVEVYGYVQIPALALCLTASLLLLAGDTVTRSRGRLGASGALIGLAALIRYDVAFAVMLAHLVALGVTAPRWRAFTRSAAPYVLGIAAVFVPPAALFVAAGGVEGFVDDVFVHAMGNYAEQRSLPFVSPLTAAGIGYLPVVAAALVAAWWLDERCRGGERGTAALAPVLVLGLVLVPWALKGLVRFSPSQMLGAVVLAIMLGAPIADAWLRRGGLRRLAAGACVAACAAWSAAGVAVIVKNVAGHPGYFLAGLPFADERSRDFAHATACLLPPRMLGVIGDHDRARVAWVLRELTAPDERILVANARHDRVVVNSVSMYWLAARLPATRWHQFDPGVQSSASIQRAMIGELEASDVSWVVRDASWSSSWEPNASASSTGVRLLDEYIESRFRPVLASGRVSLWLRRGRALSDARPVPPACTAHTG